MTTDKPTVQFSISQLRKEVVRPDPFRISLSGSKVITFPDVNAMESAESDELLSRIEKNEVVWGVLDDWLSAKDAEALRAEKLTRAELKHVMDAAGSYYKEFYGDAGNGAASAS